jgi:hypothetical protein
VSIEPFPIVDVSGWDVVTDETSGDEPKFWLQKPGAEVLWLFKSVTIKEGHTHGEDWAEKAVSHLAGRLGIPCAQIEMAEMNGTPGCISANLRLPSHALDHGQLLLEECGVPGYVHQKGNWCPGHSLENIKVGLEGALPPPGCELPFAATAYDVFAGYVLLDAWVANQDRHDNNWAVLRPDLGPSGPLRLCGSYDHGSSLGFNVTDLKMSQLLTQHRIDSWCRKGLARRFDYDHRTTLVQLAAMALELAAPDAHRYWCEQMRRVSDEEVRNVLARVPRMSDPARTFAEMVLNVNRRRVLDECA